MAIYGDFDDFDEVLNAEIARAKVAWEIANTTEPRVAFAYYNPGAGLIVLELKSGAIYSFPPNIVQGLGTASTEQLANMYVTSAGASIHWPLLDVDFSVPALLQGRFGTEAWMKR